MKNKVIYVDFANRTIKSGAIEKLSTKSFITTLWYRLKNTFAYTKDSQKTRTQAYNYKNMM
jgi:hypothetical protein